MSHPFVREIIINQEVFEKIFARTQAENGGIDFVSRKANPFRITSVFINSPCIHRSRNWNWKSYWQFLKAFYFKQLMLQSSLVSENLKL